MVQHWGTEEGRECRETDAPPFSGMNKWKQMVLSVMILEVVQCFSVQKVNKKWEGKQHFVSLIMFPFCTPFCLLYWYVLNKANF